MSASVKNFTFTLYVGAYREYAATFRTTARTQGEAEADFRHHLRTHRPDVLDQVDKYEYHVEVRHA